MIISTKYDLPEGDDLKIQLLLAIGLLYKAASDKVELMEIGKKDLGNSELATIFEENCKKEIIAINCFIEKFEKRVYVYADECFPEKDHINKPSDFLKDRLFNHQKHCTNPQEFITNHKAKKQNYDQK